MHIYKFNRDQTRKILCTSVLALSCLFIPANVWAGGINSNEARVIDVAKGGFEYDGDTYIAKQGYVNQLVGYLSGDDVNLTAEEADKAINGMYSNVKTAIESGYIAIIDSEDDDLDRDYEVKITETSPEEDVVNENDNTEEEAGPGSVISNEDGTVEIYSSDGEKIAEFDGVMKNTGFSIHSAILSSIVALVILIAVIVVALKQILFAKR